jgi:hypothetical protein
MIRLNYIRFYYIFYTRIIFYEKKKNYSSINRNESYTAENLKLVF